MRANSHLRRFKLFVVGFFILRTPWRLHRNLPIHMIPALLPATRDPLESHTLPPNATAAKQGPFDQRSGLILWLTAGLIILSETSQMTM